MRYHLSWLHPTHFIKNEHLVVGMGIKCAKSQLFLNRCKILRKYVFYGSGPQTRLSWSKPLLSGHQGPKRKMRRVQSFIAMSSLVP